MKARLTLLVVAMSVIVAGCPAGFEQRNAFVPLAELFGTSSLFGDDDDDTRGSSGSAADDEFRDTMTVTLVNNHPVAEANASFAAWVRPESIRSADQQDALISSGYVQLTRTVNIGDVYSLPPGTFVFNGTGVAGATTGRRPPTRDPDDEALFFSTEDFTFVFEELATTSFTFTLITPDAMLIFSQPPTSCESVAFSYTVDGDPVANLGSFLEGGGGAGDDNVGLNIFAGPASRFGGLKTIAQVDVYQCTPFRPGLFLRIGGGQAAANEYFEGQDIQFTFSVFADDQGFFGFVTMTP